MQCTACHHDDTKVIDSRSADEGSAIRRRRQCPSCGHRFTTYERVEEQLLTVLKSHGGREPFDRAKIVTGLRAACKGRPVSLETIDGLAESVEEELRLAGRAELTSVEVGLAVLERLRALDEVAYLRFASVYKSFDAAEDFWREATLLVKHDPPTT